MNKLLRANFARLKKDRIFWIGMAGMFLWAVLVLVTDYCVTSATPEQMNSLDYFFFKYALLSGGVCAVFTSMFLGTEYSDGTIRNKIVVGHSRKTIYLSNLFVCTVASILMTASSIFAMLAVGMPLFGKLTSDTGLVLMYLLVTVFMIAAFVSIFTMTCMLNQNKASAVVIAMLLFLGIMLAAAYCYNALNEPEMITNGIVITSDGVQQSPEPFANPHYVRGNLRTLYTFIVDFLPSGQGILMSEMAIKNPILSLLYSGASIAVTTVIGIFIFKRKNLK